MNELLREHVTSTAFHLHLGKTHVANLVYLDLKLKRNRSQEPRNFAKYSSSFVSAMHGLEDRGLIIHHLPEDYKLFKTKPREIWTITKAGRLVISLLKEAGIYDEYASEYQALENAA